MVIHDLFSCLSIDFLLLNLAIHDLFSFNSVDLVLCGLLRIELILDESSCLGNDLLFLNEAIQDSIYCSSVDLVLCDLLSIDSIHDLSSCLSIDFILLNMAIQYLFSCGSVDLVLCSHLSIFEASHYFFNGKSIELLLNSTELTRDLISCDSVGFLLLNVVIQEFINCASIDLILCHFLCILEASHSLFFGHLGKHFSILLIYLISGGASLRNVSGRLLTPLLLLLRLGLISKEHTYQRWQLRLWLLRLGLISKEHTHQRWQLRLLWLIIRVHTRH